MVEDWRKNTEEENKEKDDKDVREMNDMFDIVREVLKVNSPIATMNTDFVISDLDESLIKNNVIKYVREQLKIIEIINIYLEEDWKVELKEEQKVKVINKTVYKRTERKGNYCEKVNRILLNEVFSLVIMSRASRGKVIDAILAYIKGTATIATPEVTETKKEGILDKLNPFKKKEEKEK